MKDNCAVCQIIESIKNGTNKYFVRELETGYVVIGNNQYFYGYSLFLCKECKNELFELEDGFRQRHMEEMILVAKAVANAFKAEKMNYECLGNGSCHIHWHLYPRRNNDLGAYGDNGRGPVWWLPSEILWGEDSKPSDDALIKLKEDLKAELERLI